ncbi:transglycosylase family protein [Streptomyces sp. 71268]|uniref:LysM peptidoglycan-binding domain-containing protein n=1 Tax=Streptomyces sp. 71268 TaxID=3002640 RepID=UPI0023F91212|nr:transglycosylase family protein [Streptomyces sp. 71268]WEV27397.1 transglycosylase family protein [Streptomyces sp. 71268]
MLISKGKHRRPSKATRIATLAGVTGAAVAVPLMGATGANAATTGQWDQVAQCESTGNWSINTGNGYYGGLQFSASTWAAYGGTAYAPTADKASKAQQIQIAEKVLASQGKGAWPHCGVNLTQGGYTAPKQQAPKQQAPQQAAPKQQQAAPQQSAPKAAPKHAGPRASDDQAPSRSSERYVPKHAAPKQAAPQQSAPKTIKKGDGEYKVEAGDTLAKIAEAENVKGGWQKLYDLNDEIVTDADLIFPGQQLHLS